MGTITVNVSDETEEIFRKTVSQELGKQKGTLGKAFDEAMKKWVHEKTQKEIAERQLQLLRNGFAMGKILYKKRSELYER